MKKSVLFFSLISILCFSQQKNVLVSNLRPKSENFIFPLISLASKPNVEKKINIFLQVNELEFIPDSGKDPFHLASTATNTYRNFVYFYGWKKLETPKNILSLEMEGEASGAYSEHFVNYKNFDLRTGNLINLKDLFEPEAISEIQILVNKQIAKEITDYTDALKANGNSEEDKEVIRMYQECLEYVKDGSLEYVEFFFGQDKITVVRGRCSNHAMRALDDLDDYFVDLPFSQIEKYWSDYAKSLLSKTSKVTRQNTIENKLYKGMIDGKYPVTLFMKQLYDDGSFSAFYWYNKNKKLIEWNGNLKNNHISIIENDYHSEELKKWIPRAYIEADVNGKKISGTWQDYKTKKYLKLELEEL